jgi:hypothetical protein
LVHTSNTSPLDESIYEYPSNSSPFDENICEYPSSTSSLDEDIYDYPSNSLPRGEHLNHQEIISHGCSSSPSKESQTESTDDSICSTTIDFPFNIFKLSYPICKISESQRKIALCNFRWSWSSFFLFYFIFVFMQSFYV